MTSFADRLGMLNPQFLRECRGRLKPRSVIAAVGLSLIFQFLLYLSVIDVPLEYRMEAYRSVCRALTWAIPYGLFVLGGYYIVDDLTREEKRGTLNFIRLSPRPAREILLGKLLGVPLLPVLLAATAVPLHIVSGLIGGSSWLWMLSYYLAIAFSTAFVFSLALMFGLVGSSSSLGRQQTLSAIGFAGISLLFITPAFILWNNASIWWAFGSAAPLYAPYRNATTNLEWLYLPIADNLAVAHLFTLANLAIATLLIWQIMLRKFRIPQATLLSKRMSYIGVAYLNVLAWGFLQNSRISDEIRGISGPFALIGLNIIIFTILIFALAPSRQTLLDWLRYRRHNLADWIWNDSSPSVVAIALNCAIALLLIIPWLLIADLGTKTHTLPILLVALSLGTSVLNYATLVQIVFSMKLRSPLIWAAGIVATVAFVPPIALAILTDGAGDRSTVLIAVWTFLGLPFWESRELVNASAGIFIGWALQLVVLLLLLSRLARNLKQLSSRNAISL
ncbi:MAG: hypothetical protein WBA76_08915 [Phormidesmis sp.]